MEHVTLSDTPRIFEFLTSAKRTSSSVINTYLQEYVPVPTY